MFAAHGETAPKEQYERGQKSNDKEMSDTHWCYDLAGAYQSFVCQRLKPSCAKRCAQRCERTAAHYRLIGHLLRQMAGVERAGRSD